MLDEHGKFGFDNKNTEQPVAEVKTNKKAIEPNKLNKMLMANE